MRLGATGTVTAAAAAASAAGSRCPVRIQSTPRDRACPARDRASSSCPSDTAPAATTAGRSGCAAAASMTASCPLPG
ncbi:hypothetical protein DMP17_30010 [Pseudonocardia sp. TMWB2A]